MQKREWALVVFTLLMQAAIGTLLVVTTASLAAGPGAHPGLQAFDVPLAVAACAGGLGLAASLLHLGHPAQARFALTNVRSSWLSREIVASMMFVASAGVVVHQRRGGAGAPAAAAVAVVLGLFVIYAMSRLYMLPGQPAWNRRLTPLTFVASALLLGTVCAMAAPALDPSLARRLALVAMSLVVFQSVLTPFYLSGMPREPAAAISADPAGSTAVRLAAARTGAAIAAVVLLLIAATRGAPASTPVGVLIFASVLVSECAGRVLFYAGRASLALSWQPVVRRNSG